MKKAILIVSFGTTYPGTRQKNITAIREQVQALYPDVLIEEAVSSTIVRKAMRTREDIEAKSPAEGLEALKEKGATNVIVLPTHIIDGIENHRMKQVVQEYAQDFALIAVADALLATEEDYEIVAKALWESLKDEVGDAPLILMGHGTEHAADGSYAILETAIRNYADHEIYIATVEGAVTIEDVIARMQKKHASSTNKKMSNQRVVVTPFMLVAGDHANNDMAGSDARGGKWGTGRGFLCRKIAGRRIYTRLYHPWNRRVSGDTGNLYGAFAQKNIRSIFREQCM